jgi:cation-dependent mannose-6-phosphate receptor
LYPLFVVADEKPCTIHDGDNFYDLNKLSASKDYEFTSPGGHNFVLNVCRSVSHELWNLKVTNPERVGGFIRRDHGDFSIGETNTTLAMKEGHPLLYMSGGSNCPNSEYQATTAIQFVCDKSVFAAGQPELIAQVPDDDATACAFFIEWHTHFACPHGERGIFSSIVVVLILLILIFAMVYIVFMTLYNRYALHLSGFDQIPSLPSRLTRVLSVIGDWFQSIFSKFGSGGEDLNFHSHHWSAVGRDTGVGGSRFGSGSREEEEAMLAEDFEVEDSLGEHHGNPWGRGQVVPGSGIDSAGVIRL